MSLDEISRAMEETLDDAVLSRGERRALKMLLDDKHVEANDRALLRSRAFELARGSYDPVRSNKVLRWLEDILKVIDPIEDHEASIAEAHFSPGDACLTRLLTLIEKAKHDMQVCVFTITDDRLSRALIDARKRGVAIRVISDDDKAFDPGSDVDLLKSKGIEVRFDHGKQHMHHKFVVFDKRVLATGSYNWTRTAASENYENIVITDEPRLVAPFVIEFERLWVEI